MKRRPKWYYISIEYLVYDVSQGYLKNEPFFQTYYMFRDAEQSM